MKAKRGWVFLSFFTCFFWNAILLAFFFYAATQVLDGLQKWVDPFIASGAGLSEDVHNAFVGINKILGESRKYLAPAIFGSGGILTLILWLFVMMQGRGLANRAAREAAGTLSAGGAGKKTKAARKQPEPVKTELAPPSPQPAVQMLSILQRDGRLIDFLQEDLGVYEDAQIGAAVRNVHQGCKDALREHVELNPIYQEAEGVEVTVQPGFDSRAVRLVGNVKGDPPFKGILRHRGWRVGRIELPQPTSDRKTDLIVAPAEVEVE